MKGKHTNLFNILSYSNIKIEQQVDKDNTHSFLQSKQILSQSYNDNDDSILMIDNKNSSSQQYDLNSEKETDQMTYLLNNTWISVGEIVTNLRTQVTKQIEKVITDDIFNLKPQSSTSYFEINNQSSDYIKILDRIKTKYQHNMDSKNQNDFSNVISYFKNQ